MTAPPATPVVVDRPPERDLAAGPDVTTVTAEHARLGVRLQVAVRAVLVVFVAVTVLAVPPAHDAALAAAVAVGYTVAALGVAVWARDGGPAVARWAWLALFLDLAVLTWLTLLTGIATPQSWTAYVLMNGFPLVPVLAAATLRPRVCAAVVVPAVLVYLVAGIATQNANEEPWPALLLRTLAVAGVGAACVGLSWDPAFARVDDRPPRGGPYRAARRADRPGRPRAPGPVRAAPRRGAAVRAGRP